MTLLECSEIAKIGTHTRKHLEFIEEMCHPCRRYTQKSHRFKPTLRNDKHFNYTVYTGIFYISSKLVLHALEKEANFQTARCLESVPSEIIWSTLRMCSIDVHLGPKETRACDSGKNIMNLAFQTNSNKAYIRRK